MYNYLIWGSSSTTNFSHLKETYPYIFSLLLDVRSFLSYDIDGASLTFNIYIFVLREYDHVRVLAMVLRVIRMLFTAVISPCEWPIKYSTGQSVNVTREVR